MLESVIMKKMYLGLIVIFLLSGCGFFKKTQKPPDDSVYFVNSGKVLKALKLKKIDNLLISPFRAGPGVEATPQLDNLSLRIVKALWTTFEEEKAPFKVLDAQNASDAQYILRGHISGKTSPGLLKKFVLQKKDTILAVEGNLIEKKTGDIVLVFSHQEKMSAKEGDEQDLARQMGQTIALYILNRVTR